MRSSIFLFALGLALSSASSPGRGDEPAQTFLNGKDLAGWEGLIEDYWGYKHGAIIGLTPQGLGFNTFL